MSFFRNSRESGGIRDNWYKDYIKDSLKSIERVQKAPSQKEKSKIIGFTFLQNAEEVK